MSPACQPYTVLNPNAKGAADPRAQSFLHLIENVLPALSERGAAPVRLLVENVAGFEVRRYAFFLSFYNGPFALMIYQAIQASTTRDRVLAILAKLGFVTRELLLTPLQFGVPNSRLRYYLLAARRPSDAFFPSVDSRGILPHIPGHGAEWSDARLSLSSSAAVEETVESNVRPLRDYLDRADRQLAYPVPERVLMKWGRLFDIVLPSAMRTCCFTRGQFGLLMFNFPSI